MRIEWHPEARKDLQQLDTETREKITKQVGELSSNPLGENTSLFRKQGLDLFRLKLKNGDLDHRIFYDINDGIVEVYGVMHRDTAYTKESIQRIKSRT